MGLSKYVIENYDTEKLITLTQNLYNNYTEVKVGIKSKLSYWEKEFDSIFQKIFS